MGPKEPVRNECEFLYEMFHILNCGSDMYVEVICEIFRMHNCGCEIK